MTEIGQNLTVDHSKVMQLFQYEQQALWTLIISHVRKEVLAMRSSYLTGRDLRRR